jgi:hypothetical protein
MAHSTWLFLDARLVRVQHCFTVLYLWANCIPEIVFVFRFFGLKDGALERVDAAF